MGFLRVEGNLLHSQFLHFTVVEGYALQVLHLPSELLQFAANQKIALTCKIFFSVLYLRGANLKSHIVRLLLS